MALDFAEKNVNPPDPSQEFDFDAQAYEGALRTAHVGEHHLAMLRAHYWAPGRTISASEMAVALGYSSHGVANLHYGKLGRLVGLRLGWTFSDYYVRVLATFTKRLGEWHWVMRPAVAEALERLHWVAAQPVCIPEEVAQGAAGRPFMRALW